MTSAGSVLVTGAGGFVGSRVVDALASRGLPTVTLDHAWGSRDDLERALDGTEVERCIHLGWYAAPGDYLTNGPANLRSLASSAELVEHLGGAGCRRLVAVGSCAEYAPSAVPLAEGDPIGPWSVYGAAKASLHLLLESSWRPSAMACTWARLFNLTGPGEHPDRLVPMVTRAVLAGEAVDLSGGEQVRDFLDVDDVASALVHLALTDSDGPVNVCSGAGVTLRSLLTAIAARAGSVEGLRFGARDRGANDPDHVVGDDRRLRATGWVPTYPFEKMVDRVVAFWRDQPASGHQ